MITAVDPIERTELTDGQKSLRRLLYIGIGVWVTLMFLFLAACIMIDWH